MRPGLLATLSAQVAAVSGALCLLAGCASQVEVRDAIHDVNKEFQREYEAIIAERGIRTFPVRRGDAYVGLHATLGRLGMQMRDQDPDLGTLNFESPAPRPLDSQEWSRAAAADLPKMREIARRHVGMAANFISFEPEGLLIVVNAAVLEAPSGSEISLTMRMREVAPPKSGMPRREYPPPTALRIGLDKIWAQLEQELRAARKIP